MTFVVTPVQDDIYTAVKAMIVAAIPIADDHVIKGNQNRVAMPTGPFIMMNTVSMKRLRTNVDTWDTNDPDPSNTTREQGLQLELQLDFYGPNSADWANIFTTLFRDEYGCTALAPNCQPLYADDAARGPLVTGEDQYLDRWIVRAQIQYNPVVVTPDQFAEIVSIDVFNVDVEYPST